jgi:hypothetical protein
MLGYAMLCYAMLGAATRKRKAADAAAPPAKSVATAAVGGSALGASCSQSSSTATACTAQYTPSDPPTGLSRSIASQSITWNSVATMWPYAMPGLSPSAFLATPLSDATPLVDNETPSAAFGHLGSIAEQSRAEQSRAEHSRAQHSRAEQSRAYGRMRCCAR